MFNWVQMSKSPCFNYAHLDPPQTAADNIANLILSEMNLSPDKFYRDRVGSASTGGYIGGSLEATHTGIGDKKKSNSELEIRFPRDEDKKRFEKKIRTYQSDMTKYKGGNEMGEGLREKLIKELDSLLAN